MVTVAYLNFSKEYTYIRLELLFPLASPVQNEISCCILPILGYNIVNVSSVTWYHIYLCNLCSFLPRMSCLKYWYLSPNYTSHNSSSPFLRLATLPFPNQVCRHRGNIPVCGRFLVWISAGILAILAEPFCGFPQFFQADARIISQILRNCFLPNFASPVILPFSAT